MCVDYTAINQRTLKDSYALPRIDEIFDSLQGAKYFTTLDMKAAYRQVEVEEEHKPHTAFTVGPYGFYQYSRMPFGLTNSPATYERIVEQCLGDLNMRICVCYLDDVIIYSSTFKEHLDNIDTVFSRIKGCNLKLAAEKCQFYKQKVSFLGHVVGGDGIETDPDKIDKVRDWPTPKTLKS